MATVAKQIDPSPPAPSRQDPVNFDVKGDAMLAFIEDKLVDQINAVSAQLNAQADEAIAQGAAATQAAIVAAQAKVSAADSAAAALASAQAALAQANIAVAKAADALASASAAAAIQGIPTVAGNQLKTLRVNAAGDGIEWTQTGDALGFAPVQQGGGIGQGNNKIYVGWASAAAAGPGLKATIDGTDLGYIATSSTPTSGGGPITYGQPVIATSFNGLHFGNAANLTGFTASQIIAALAYTPTNNATFNPGAIKDIGVRLDFHQSNAANDYDAALQVENVGSASGSATLVSYSNGFRLASGTMQAPFFSGNGSLLSGITYAQMPFAPARADAPTITNGATVISGGSNFDGAQHPVLTVQALAAGYSAHMQHLIPGVYGIKAGLESNAIYCIGGWSQGSGVYRLQSDTAGNLTALGNVTAYSDIRFKTELEPLRGVVKRLLLIEHGGMRYLDTRTGEHKYGASAQAVIKYFPDAGVRDPRGFLSLAYGQLALAALIETTREFQQQFDVQQRQIDGQQAQIAQLMERFNGA